MGSAMGWEVQTPNDRIKQKRLPPSVRKEAANLWERRLTSSNSRSITLVVRSYCNRLSGRHKRSDSLPDQIALEALDGCWVGELYFLIKRPRSAVIALVPSLQRSLDFRSRLAYRSSDESWYSPLSFLPILTVQFGYQTPVFYTLQDTTILISLF